MVSVRYHELGLLLQSGNSQGTAGQKEGASAQHTQLQEGSQAPELGIGG